MALKPHTEEHFRKLCEEKHLHLDFSKTVYKTSRIKVEVNCAVHGDFLIRPLDLLVSHSGCKKCSKKRVNPNTVNRSIERAKKVHGDLYDYSLIDPTLKSLEYQKIICKEHGVYEQQLHNHYRGRGCPECGKEKSLKYNNLHGCGWSKTEWSLQELVAKRFDGYKVYIIKCWNESEIFYKIGRTFNTLKRRFNCKTDMPYNYEVFKIFKFTDSNDAFNTETKLKAINKSKKYIPQIKFAGSQECFTKIILE